ncbi:proliferating cell nuclear antigen [Tanacetum coccineum]
MDSCGLIEEGVVLMQEDVLARVRKVGGGRRMRTRLRGYELDGDDFRERYYRLRRRGTCGGSDYEGGEPVGKAQDKIVDFEMKLSECHAIVRMPLIEFSRICNDLITIVMISISKGVKFSTRGDIGTANVVCRQLTTVDKVIQLSLLWVTLQEECKGRKRCMNVKCLKEGGGGGGTKLKFDDDDDDYNDKKGKTGITGKKRSGKAMKVRKAIKARSFKSLI